MQVGTGSSAGSSVGWAIAAASTGTASFPAARLRKGRRHGEPEAGSSEYHVRGSDGPSRNPVQRAANEHLEVPIRGDRGSARGAH